MEEFKKNGHILLALGFYIISFIIYLYGLSWLPLKTGSALENPPWYFIGVDLKKFFASIFCLLLAGPVYYLMYRSGFRKVRDGLLFLSVWLIYPIIQGVLIFIKTRNIFNPELASTTIETHEEYLKLKDWSFYILITIGVFLVAYKIWLQKSEAANTDFEQ